MVVVKEYIAPVLQMTFSHRLVDARGDNVLRIVLLFGDIFGKTCYASTLGGFALVEWIPKFGKIKIKCVVDFTASL
jgi:hypothetical protein